VRRRAFITLLGGAREDEAPRVHIAVRPRGAAWSLAAAAQSTTQPIQAMTAKLPQIEVVRRDAYRPSCSNAVSSWLKAFSLGGFEDIGDSWKMPPPSTRATVDGEAHRLESAYGWQQ